MFYAQFVLSKKGPLAKLWLAAHWDKKLSKAQIYETNVEDAANEIMKPKGKLALRTTGHLLLGLMRIYARKAKYLLSDCNEAFLKIKMAFRPGDIEFRDEHDPIINSLPEVIHDFDAALPDFNDFDFNPSQIAIQQSRLDDITLREDPIADKSLGFGEEIGLDDFGERESNAQLDLDNDDEFSTFEHGRNAMESDFGARPSDLNFDDDLPPSANMDLDDDFGDHGFGENDDLGSIFNEHEFNKGLEGLEAPGTDLEVGAGSGGALTPIQNVTPYPHTHTPLPHQMTPHHEVAAPITLDPIETTSVYTYESKIGRPRGSKKRKLIVDEIKNITGDEMKSNMADFSDTIQTLDLAPPTRKLMKLKETGMADKLFSQPGCSFLQDHLMTRLYQSHLIPHAMDAGRISNEDIRRDLDLAESVEDVEYYMAPSIQGDDDYSDHTPTTPLDQYNGQTNQFELGLIDEVDENLQPEVTEEKRRRSKNERQVEEEEEVEADEDEDVVCSRRSHTVLKTISTKLKSTDSISLNDLLSKGTTRKTAAAKFYSLLELKKSQAIDVNQDVPFGDIRIMAGPQIATVLAK